MGQKKSQVKKSQDGLCMDSPDYFKQTALGIKSEIIHLIGDQIGFYTFANGKSTPAIAILETYPSNWPLTGTKVSGVEVVIIYPEVKVDKYLGEYSPSVLWTVIINQREYGKTLNYILLKLLRMSYDITSQIITPEIKEKGIPETLRIIIRDYLEEVNYECR